MLKSTLHGVGFEPTHRYRYQNTQECAELARSITLESGALDHSAIRATPTSRQIVPTILNAPTAADLEKLNLIFTARNT